MEISQLVKFGTGSIKVRAKQVNGVWVRLTILEDGRYNGRVGSTLVKGQLSDKAQLSMMQCVTAALTEVQP